MSDKPAPEARRKAQAGKKNALTTAPDGASPKAAARSGGDQPPEGVKALALDYPLAIVAGGLAVGVLIGALLPRRQASRLSRPVLAAVAAASEFGMAYAQKALSRAAEVAHEAGAAGNQVLDAAGERADDLASDAAGYADRVAAVVEATPAALRDSGRRLAQGVVRLTSQLRH